MVSWEAVFLELEQYRARLKKELRRAEGCTEPAAVAFAAAKAAELLEARPEKIRICCSGNIAKNVMGVIIPHSGGRRGLAVAAILGALGGDASRGLEVLDGVDAETVGALDEHLASGLCECTIAEGKTGLYIDAEAVSGEKTAEVVLDGGHENIVYMRIGETVLTDRRGERKCAASSGEELSLDEILAYAENESADVLRELLRDQIECNTAIAEEGARFPYGAAVGQALLAASEGNALMRSAAMAACAADARMGGCEKPVVINSGSGNQGIAASVPVIEYARRTGVCDESLYRALALSNLVTMLQKQYIGPLSAYCGAVCAGCGAGAGITYLRGGGYAEIEATITNTLGTISGMICDGAKASCAAKIAAAVSAANLAGEMSLRGSVFQPGEGIVGREAAETVRYAGAVGREGMRETDRVILELMLHGL